MLYRIRQGRDFILHDLQRFQRILLILESVRLDFRYIAMRNFKALGLVS